MNILRRALLLLVLGFCCLGVTGGDTGGDAAKPPAGKGSEDVSALKAEIERLNAQNAKLKEENQTLRKLFALPQDEPSVSKKAEQAAQGQPQTLAPVPAPKDDSGETDWWLTASSNKRHNKNCRYYKTSRGRFCGPNDGIACKVCGG